MESGKCIGLAGKECVEVRGEVAKDSGTMRALTKLYSLSKLGAYWSILSLFVHVSSKPDILRKGISSLLIVQNEPRTHGGA